MTLGIALALPFVAFALPRLMPTSLRTGPAARTPVVTLHALWRRFEAAHDMSAVSTDDLIAWFGSADGLDVRSDLDPNARWWIERAGGEATIGTADEDGRTEWRLEVRRAPWSGLDATLAASDLKCVLCHARVDGARPVRVLSVVPFEAGIGADVCVDGTLEAAPDGLLTPDLVGALDSASLDPGFVTCSLGGLGSTAAAAIEGSVLEPVRIEAESDGPVVLFGGPDDPIRISGDCVIRGDLVLSGSVVGDGSLRVLGNVYIPGNLLHTGTGSLRILVRGSVLVGEVNRPRRGEALPVTGGVDGSFGFLVESLARFNGAIAQQATPGDLFTVRAGQPAPFLRSGARSTGSWHDPALELVDDRPRHAVGPGSGSGLGLGAGAGATSEPWITAIALWAAGEPGRSGPIGESAAGTRLEALFVVDGAFVAVAAGIDTWRDTGGAIGGALNPNGAAIDGEGPPPGALFLDGALVATHAAIHAPAGLIIVDDPRARAAVRLPAARGLIARLIGPSSSTALGGPGKGTGRGQSPAPTRSVSQAEAVDTLVRLLPSSDSDSATPR